MAKKMGKGEQPVDLVTLTERALRESLTKVPGLQSISEVVYCETVLSALDLIREGLDMRLQELQREEE